jgi:hypothetical protein
VQKNEIQCKKRNTVQKKKYSANFIDYFGFLIALKYETKIANKIQQFPTEIIQKKPVRICTRKHTIIPIQTNQIFMYFSKCLPVTSSPVITMKLALRQEHLRI